MMQRRLREEELRILRGQAKVDESAIDSQLAEGGRRQLDGGGGRPVGARAGGRPGGAGGGMPRGGGMEADPNVTGGMMMPDDSSSPSDDEDEDDSDEGVRRRRRPPSAAAPALSCRTPRPSVSPAPLPRSIPMQGGPPSPRPLSIRPA